MFAVARNNKLLIRLILKAVFYPGVLSLAVLCILCSIAEYTFTSLYFVLGSIWKPAFPLSWRLLLLSLFVVPAFSLLHLLHISAHRLLLARYGRHRLSSRLRSLQGYLLIPRSEPRSSEDRDSSDARTDEGSTWTADFEHGDAGSPRQSRCQHHTPRHHSSTPSLLHLVFWLIIFSSSLWLGLHYQHPGDVRYLPLIEKAIAHPNRAGYANQGEYGLLTPHLRDFL